MVKDRLGIALITNLYPPTVGGISVHVATLHRHYKDRGYDPRVIAYPQ